MTSTMRLTPPDGVVIRIEKALPFAHELPLAVALESASHPEAVILWRHPAAGVSGFFHALGRTAWPDARLLRLHAVMLQPGAGPGAVGLELVLDDGAEIPVLVSRPFREETAEWMQAEMEELEAFLGVDVSWKDYGEDR